VFDTLLCGGLLLTEPTQDLLDLFSVGTHLLTYRDENEMRERISQMVADPSTARSIAEAGRRFVREGHTIHHRVQTMLEALVSRQLGGERLKQVVEQGDGLVLE
jgi:spore maturation protein CgeB